MRFSRDAVDDDDGEDDEGLVGGGRRRERESGRERSPERERQFGFLRQIPSDPGHFAGSGARNTLGPSQGLVLQGCPERGRGFCARFRLDPSDSPEMLAPLCITVWTVCNANADQ